MFAFLESDYNERTTVFRLGRIKFVLVIPGKSKVWCYKNKEDEIKIRASKIAMSQVKQSCKT